MWRTWNFSQGAGGGQIYGSWLHAWLLDGRRADLARRTRGATRAHGLHTWRCPRTRGLWHVVAVTAVTAVAARVRAGGGERPCSQSALETNSERT